MGLIIDLFAGGGGASEGIEQALGRPIDIAINHDADAIAMHQANHPQARHYQESVWNVFPTEVCAGQPVDFLWASPDCTHFSKAKGGKPRKKEIRSLADVVILWARDARPAVIMLENVEEFQTWGPLDDDGFPIKAKAGEDFRRWWGELEALGYHVEKRILKASDYGAPTIRKRLFIVARRDGRPIRWPAATHGDPRTLGVGAGQLKPWRTAAECIDWTIPVRSIFDRAKPLAEATERRIAHGIKRFVIDEPNPFLITIDHRSSEHADASVDEPLGTTTAKARHALAVPHVTRFNQNGAGQDPREPLDTVMAGAPRFGVAVPYLAGVGGRMGQSPERSVEDPYHTITSKADTVLATPYLASLTHQGGERVEPLGEPMATVTGAHRGEKALVTPFLARTAYKGANGQYVTPMDEPHRTLTAQQDGLSLVAPAIVRMNHDGQGKPADSVSDPMATVTTQVNKLNLVAAFMVKHFGGHETPGAALDRPASTITARDHQALATSHLVKMYGTSQDGAPVTSPMPTTSAQGLHVGEVRAFLAAYYGNDRDGQAIDHPLRTVTAKDRLALIYVHGEPYVITDIGMRMLSPAELFRAQGFPSDYVIELERDGKPLTKTAQVRLVGNSVVPNVARALVAANVHRTPDASTYDVEAAS